MIMRLLLAIVVCATTMGTTAQVVQKGDFALDLGVEGGYYNVDIHQRLGELDSTYADTAATFFVPFHFEYMLSNKFAIGAVLKSGRYLSDDNSDNNQVTAFGVSLSYHPVVTEKLDLFVRVGVGSSALKIREVVLVEVRTDFAGPAIEIDTGLKFYFSEHFGLNFNVGWNSYNLDIKEASIGGESLDLDDVDWTLDVKGVEVGLGFAARF